jgi:hypothetical protein
MGLNYIIFITWQALFASPKRSTGVAGVRVVSNATLDKILARY